MSKFHPTVAGDRLPRAAKIAAACMLAAAAVGLASCVASETPLVVESKPILGQQFDMVLYRDFIAGRGYAAQEVRYQWSDGNYVRPSAKTKRFVKIAAEPLENGDLLVERSRADHSDTTSNLYDYWIARKMTEGTYLFFPLNENDLTPEDRGKICSKDQPEGFCVVSNHEALLVSARATARKPVREPAVGILIDDGVREGKSDSLDKAAR